MVDSEVTPSDSIQEWFRWRTHWIKRGMPWRTEPEIDEVRQAFLQVRAENAWTGRDPTFQGVALTRADVEWLITYWRDKHGQITLDWRVSVWDEIANRLNLIGADLSRENLSNLPLTGLVAGGGMSWDESAPPSEIQFMTRFEGTDLSRANLEGASLAGANLAGADLSNAHLEGAALMDANLRGARLSGAHLEGANLARVDLEGAIFFELQPREGGDEDVQDPWDMTDPFIEAEVWLQGADLAGANLRNTNLRHAHLEGSSLVEAQLEGCDLSGAHLEGIIVREGDGSWLSRRLQPGEIQTLPPVQLQQASFDFRTRLEHVHLGDDKSGYVSVADVFWGGVNLAVAPWQQVSMLGDERVARAEKTHYGVTRRVAQQLTDGDYEVAIRANRQLSLALRSQGLSEHADRFAYRAQLLQRVILRRQKKFLRYLGSTFLGVISGYGYKPMRSFLTYLLVVGSFALTYYVLGNNVHPPLDPLGAVVFSITSFHGRGFTPGENVAITNPVTVLAAFEAIIGLLIEITFIATFTQRFFAR